MSHIHRLIQEKLIQKRITQIETDNDEDNVLYILLDPQTNAELGKIAQFLSLYKEDLVIELITRAIIEFKQECNQELIPNLETDLDDDDDLILVEDDDEGLILVEDDNNDLLDDEDEPKVYYRKNPKTNLKIFMPDGGIIIRKTAAQAFVEAITRLDIEAVKSLGYKCCKVDLVSTHKSHESQYSVGKYWIMTGISTQRKKEFLEKIANDLGKKIKIYVIH